MKNPYKMGKVHPSPSQPPTVTPPSAAFLSLLPAAILSLTAALSPQDKEVLAYLISSCHVNNSSSSSSAGQRKAARKAAAAKDHGPAFECSCFRCYTTFWARWDASPNRHVIHDIIEAYEESLTTSSSRSRQKKSKKRSATSSRRKEGELAVESSAIEQPVTDDASCGGGEGVVEDDVEKSAVRKIVSFVGDRIIGIFGV